MNQQQRIELPVTSGIVLETMDLKKYYMQGKVEIRALDGVNLKVEAGELISVLGPSGSGKSTLLNMIGALDRPTSGTIMIEGQDIGRMNKDQLAEVRRRIGFVFQYFNLIGRLTALQNVELPMTVKGMKTQERKEKAIQFMNLVGLGDRITHRPSELSGGQQQRVAIARALAQEPRFMLMDEPTGNIDTHTRDEVLGLVKRLNEEHHVTTVIITHDAMVASITNRTVYIVDGKLYNSHEEALEAERISKAELEERTNDEGGMTV
ncbi:MAG TPA: ABC transporter ATP-binding protein [Candidatus Lokiarchaeia archaeon]|nr:ABC transporter ATP-binding protein [Candidatus Lokiarchaeia archaeon]